jgi:glucose-6-phosphate 1-dehydrogenase
LITGKGLDIKESSINISWKNDKQTKIIISPYIPLEKDTVIYNEKAVSISDNFLDGYNAVFFNVFNNNKSVFTSNDEILQSWKIFDPLLKKWYSQKKIKTYKKGSNLKDII